MSDHAWVLENLASYVADGLEAEERTDLEEHAAGCAECSRALGEARMVQRRLEGLFADARPSPALEDWSIQALRRESQRPGARRLTPWVKALLAGAAAVFLAVMGAGVSALIDEGEAGFRLLSNKSYFGVDVAAGTIEARRSAAELAKAVRERAENALRPRQKEAKQRFAMTEIDGDGLPNVNYDVDRKVDVSVPGVANQDEQVASADPRLNPMVGSLSGHSGATHGKSQEDGGWAYRSHLRGYFRPTEIWGYLPGGDNGLKKEEAGRGEKKGEPAPEQARHKEDEEEREGQGKGNNAGQKQPKEQPPAPVGRKIIRTGELEFEVDSFNAAVAVITRLVTATKGGFVASERSTKLANGKMRGVVVVRVPPEHLDRLVLDLRLELGKTGELKGQRIGSEDVSKAYTDLDSELRAARTMEERLLKIIREGKGQIKELLEAEHALGEWRTKIERLEGELRWLANQVALSTLTVKLAEKEIRTAAAVAESERVQAGIEVDDVEKAMRAALQAVEEAKGRVTKSEMKQHAAGQYSATLHFEVEPDSAGPVRDQLRQLGAMVRLEIDRVQQAEGGGPAPKDGKLHRGRTQFYVSLYNLANVAPRETVTLKVAAAEVEPAFRKLREALARARGRIINAQLNEKDRKNVSAQLDFDVRRPEEGAVVLALKEAGEVMSRHVARLPEGENVTDAKVLYKVELVQADAQPPRERVTLALEVADVEAALAVLDARVKEAGGQAEQPTTTQEPSGQVVATVTIKVPLAAATGLAEKLKGLGQVRVWRQVRSPQAPEGKLAQARLDVTLSNAELLVPRDERLWTQVRGGLAVSLHGLLMSARWLIVGVLFVLPWLLLLWAVVWLARRLWRGSTPVPAAPVAGGTAATGG
jgi:hypothetical protein